VTSKGRRRTAPKQGKVIAGWLLNSTPSPTQYFNAPAFKTNNKTGKFDAIDSSDLNLKLIRVGKLQKIGTALESSKRLALLWKAPKDWHCFGKLKLSYNLWSGALIFNHKISKKQCQKIYIRLLLWL